MSGVVGSACCCDTEAVPCIGAPGATCAPAAIVVEGFMSYGISSSTDELHRRTSVCQQSCGSQPWPPSEGESNRTNVASFAETARSRFKALLVKSSFGPGDYNEYSTPAGASNFQPVVSMNYNVSASGEFKVENEQTACLPCNGSSLLRFSRQTLQGNFGQGSQEEITGLGLAVYRSTRYIDCDNVPSCVGELLTPGCYEVYQYRAFGTADGVEATSELRDYYRREEVIQFSDQCRDVIVDDTSSSETAQTSIGVALNFDTYAKIDEFDACPPIQRLPINAMVWNGTSPLLPGCNIPPNCPVTCCGEVQGGEMFYAYDGYGGSYFSGAGTSQGFRWYANLPHCSNVASNEGIESESRSLSETDQINCIGGVTCFNGSDEPEAPVTDLVFDLFREGSLEDAIVYDLTITRKEVLFTMPDPADWPNGV